MNSAPEIESATTLNHPLFFILLVQGGSKTAYN
jgi:hypothetical protein